MADRAGLSAEHHRDDLSSSELTRANACWRRRDLEGAISGTRRAIRAQPLFPLPYRNLARLWERQHQPQHQPQTQTQAERLRALADQLETLELRWRRLAIADPPGSPGLERQRTAIETSGLFDGAWYGQQHPELALLAIEPAEHWLRCGVALGWNPSGGFDSRFYLELHEAVERAGENPLLHHLREGRAQGLATTPAVFGAALRRSTSQLWGPHRQRAEAELRALLADPATPLESRLVGGQQLAAALGWWGHWPEAEATWRAMPAGRARSLGLALLLQQQGRSAEARPLLQAWGANQSTADAQLRLAWANGCAAAERLEVLNSLWRRRGLVTVQLREAEAGLGLDNLAASAPACRQDWGLVSVIVPVRNGAATLATALASLCNQSYGQLEVLVVDDASDDATAAIAERWADRDGRVRLLRQRRRGGAYRARNRGLAVCRGELITCHDADDWSHPQKLERQLRALQGRPQRLASLSCWARCSDGLVFRAGWRIWPQLVHDNLSSLLVRRTVLERLGGWDPVLVGADAEYRRRICALGGAEAVAVVEPHTPLSLARLGQGTLTAAAATHVSSTLHGLRYSYRELTRLWQERPGGLERASQRQRWRRLPPECFGRSEAALGVCPEAVAEGDCGDFRWLEQLRSRGHWRWLRHRPGAGRTPLNPGEPLALHPLCLELLEERNGRLLL